MDQPNTFRLRDNVGLIVLIGVVLGLLATAAFWLLDQKSSLQSERVIQEISIATPPPPPPPPPEEKVEEVEEVKPIEQPQPTPTPQPPSPTPSDAPPSPSPSTEAAGLDRLADAGSDSFNLGAGKGGGLFGRGGGGGGGEWDAAVNLHITRALQRDPRTRSAQGSLKVAITMDTQGRFTSARLLSSTGDADLDKNIADVLSKLPPMGKPKPAGAASSFTRTINLKR